VTKAIRVCLLVCLLAAHTGVQIDHPEIAGRAFAVGKGGFDAFEGDGTDGHGHGTHCAGIVGGNTTGVAKNTTIYSVRVLDEMGSGTIATLVDGLNHVANSKLPKRIASMSLGGGLAEALNEAVEAAVKAGVLVIVAAGNEAGPACEVSPGECAVLRISGLPGRQALLTVTCALCG
jgi:subtilisin family serine protease